MTRHVHRWTEAPDWDWGPGTVTYECVACRGLRIERASGARGRAALPPAASAAPLGLRGPAAGASAE